MCAKSDSVVLFSGGLDSTVLLADEIARGHHPYAVSVMYGQRHVVELTAARKITDRLQVPHVVVEIPNLRAVLRGSSQTDDVPVPDGHYAAENMKATVVPNRNMILLSVALAAAVGADIRRVVYAAHAGDHTIYPDCRPEFVQAMKDAASRCDFNPIALDAPFVFNTKAEIVRRGQQIGAPLHLTWSCYKGGGVHCGKCGTCQERIEAFALAGVPDPTVYA